MPAAPTIDQLTVRVYRHYPRGIDHDDPRHGVSEETRRLACVHEAAAIACGKGYLPVPDEDRVAIDPEVQEVVDALRAWKAFGERCRGLFPDLVVWDESGPFFDPAYTYSVTKPGYVHPSDDGRDPVFCVVSVLAPVYAIYTYDGELGPSARVRYEAFPARYRPRIDGLSRLAEEVFGFTRLDGDVLQTWVSDVMPFACNRVMGDVTLMDCLFSSCVR